MYQNDTTVNDGLATLSFSQDMPGEVEDTILTNTLP